MSAETKTTVLGRLEEREALVAAAEARVEELTAEQGRANHALDRAMGPLRGYHEEVGAGEREPDEAEEAELLAAVRSAGQAITFEHVHTEGRLVSLEPRDERVRAQLEGAARKLDQRRGELEAFKRSHFVAIAEELAPLAKAARDRLQAAWDEAEREARGWSALVRRWHTLLEAGGLTPRDLPGHPFRGVGDAVDDGVPLPMPRSLWPEEER